MGLFLATWQTGTLPLPAFPAEFRVKTPIDQAKLVAAARRGDAEAFALLCEPATPRIFQKLCRMTHNREDAEDAMQDALLSAFRNIRRFEGRSTFSTWLTRVAINSALMSLRKRRGFREVSISQHDPEPEAGPILEVPDHAPNPERRYAQLEQHQTLHAAVRKLRPGLRKAVELRQLRECSMEETAETLGISVAAAKGRLFHARAALRKSPTLKRIHPGRRRDYRSSIIGSKGMISQRTN